MMGRYGQDQLNRLLSITGLIILVVSVVIVRFIPLLSSVLWIAAVALIVICYWRMFSRNIAARSAENQRYLTFRYKFAVEKQRRAERAAQSKDYKFFKCPKCGVLNRIPKGKGEIEITCPRCGEKFIRKS